MRLTVRDKLPSLFALLVLVFTAITTAAQPSDNDESRRTDRVVVLPFENISESAGDNWIGVGIAETIATGIDHLENVLIVREQGGRLYVAETRETTLDVARQSGAGWVISGAYQRLGDQLRLTARITNADTGAVARSTTVDGRVNELFTLQDRLVDDLRAVFEGGQATTAAMAPVAIATADPPIARQAPADTAPRGRSDAASSRSLVIDGPPAPEPPATINRGANGEATVRAIPLTAPLQIDGTLDEAVYETIQPFSGFIQQLPDEGDPATERTDAWIFFDGQNVYISGRLWDSAPESEWVANEMQRDSRQLINNERFSVAFDTFYDRRNAVVFMVNPIGGFYDHEIADEGSPNADWNPVWDVRTGRFDGGWTVEMEIPFKSLRYQLGSSQLWGVQVARRIRWKNESAYLTPVPMSAGPGLFRVSAAATLTGLEVPPSSRRLEVKPYAIGSLATDVNTVPAITNQGAADFGVDVKYGVTQNLTADFTYNTDFAQVEVDEQQVNLTRFSLFFPEKREFFLESRGTFDFGSAAGGIAGGGPRGGRGGGGLFGGGDVPTVFFSRRIGLEGGQTVPILGGGRLTGKVGDFSVGALNIQTDDALSAEALATNFTVLRVKRDVLRRSRIGGIFTGRSISTKGPGSNQVFGLDAAFSFYENVNLNGYYARSQTPGMTGEDASYQAAFNYTGDIYRFQLDHLLVGDHFNPEVGFLRRDDFRRTYTQAQYRPRPSLRAVRQFTFGSSLDYIETVAGVLETRIAQARFDIEFENSDQLNVDVQESYERLQRPFRIASDVSIPVGAYKFQDYFVSYTLGQQRRASGSFSLQRGEFFDGHITALGYQRSRITVTSQFSFEPGLSINRIELPGGHFTAQLLTSRLTYTLTPRMFFGGLVQYNSGTQSLNANLRLRWEYSPGSELFVVYNDVRDTALRGTPILQNRAFIIKFTKLFRF